MNSVPRFENAWMQRSKFPYSARSSAKVIRHAVSIDERRAKFRQDLISQQKRNKNSRQDNNDAAKQSDSRGKNARHETAPNLESNRFRRSSQARPTNDENQRLGSKISVHEQEGRLMPRLGLAENYHSRSGSPAYGGDGDASSINTDTSQVGPPRPPGDEDDIDEAAEQDIEELWFPGTHADLGGGWPLSAGEELPLSHGPLVWMVREARRAGLDFDSKMMIKLKCCDDNYNNWSDSNESIQVGDQNIPEVQVTSSSSPNIFDSPKSKVITPGWAPGMQPEEPKQSKFHRTLHVAATKGTLHDCLEYGGGLGVLSVISWKMMEYLPFRRMDLKPDGSWVAISFP